MVGLDSGGLEEVKACAEAIQAFTVSELHMPVSYTHLTLPTIYSVEISAVAVSLKKNNNKKKKRHFIAYDDSHQYY